MSAATHPDTPTLTAFGLGRLPNPRRSEVEAHVAGCPDCCKVLENVAPDSLLGLARAAMATPSAAAAETLPPDDVPVPLIDHPRYRVLAKLGAGGMGVVYKAEHRVMGRTVALKVLNPGMTSNAGAADRFRREVRLAARLSHQHIVTAHDADEAGGLHFLVMEYVEGMSLDRFVAKKGPVQVPLACLFVRQAALGLQHAFEKGMVHRDIKPHNLMVTKKGQVKVLDFGLAQLAAPEDRASSVTTPGMTAPGMVVGTPDFVAPEQAKASTALDHRADIYSLGCTLYFLLTTRPPFPGGTAIEKLIAHVQQEPQPVTLVRPEVPAGVAAVLNKMMAKKPDDRYQTPAEVAAALLPFVKSGGPASGKTPTVPAADVVPAVTLPLPQVSRSVAVPIPATASVVRTAVRAEAADGDDEEDRPSPRRKKAKKKKSFVAEHPVLVGVVSVTALMVVLVLGLAASGVFSPREKSVAAAVPTPDTGKPKTPDAVVKPSTPGIDTNPKPDSAKVGAVVTANSEPTAPRPQTPQPQPGPPPATVNPPPKPRPNVPASEQFVLVVLAPKEVHEMEYESVRKGLANANIKAKTVGLNRDPIRLTQPPPLGNEGQGMEGPGGGPGRPGPGLGGPGGRPFLPKKGGQFQGAGPGGGLPPRGQNPPGQATVTPEHALAQVTDDYLDKAIGVVFLGGGGMGGESMLPYLPNGSAEKDIRRVIDRMLADNKVLAGFGPGGQILHEYGAAEPRGIVGHPYNDPNGANFMRAVVAELKK